MKKFNNMKIGLKMSISFLIIIVLLMGVAFIGYFNTKTVNDGMTTMYADRLVPIEKLGHAESAFYKVRGEVLRFILLPQQRGEVELEINTQIAVVEDSIDAYKDTILVKEETDELAKFEIAFLAYKKSITDVLVKTKANTPLAEIVPLLDLGSAGSNARIVMSDSIENLIAINVDIANETSKQGTVTFENATMLLIGASFFALIIAMLISMLLSRSITNPITNIVKIAQQISNGDLTAALSSDQRDDEFGLLLKAFRNMQTMLRKSIGELTQMVSLISTSASEMLATTTQIASSSAETAASIMETTTTVEEVRQAAELSSQKAQIVSNNSSFVANNAEIGQKAVEKNIIGVDQIRVKMDIINQTIVRLNEQTQSIGGIIASVTDIANQSNLLAVNAAIEAAKAGDQGKGFAVVAQEIRNLAEQSKQATIQVRNILNDVQKATSNAAIATEQGSKACEDSVIQANQAGESIQTLAETSLEAVQSAVLIVASSQQQVVGMDQIVIAMEDINQAGNQNVSGMKQMELAAQNLHHLGNKLKELIERFNTKE